MPYPAIYLKKNEDRRIRQGHLWIFSNEIDNIRSPFNTLTAGDLVSIFDHKGQSLGTAYLNPHTLIAARLISRQTDIQFNRAFFKARLQTALHLRERLFDKPYYRLIFGESDGIPGLVIDRFGDVFALQITTAGIEKQRDELSAALIELFKPQAIVLKNDNSQRQLENLSNESCVVYGELPNELWIEENHAQFKINILEGQKTGWFYDHRESRARCASLCKNQQVLDLFSYSGAWGITAALAGATQVSCVDSSEAALTIAKENAQRNQVGEKMQFFRSDVFEFLKNARDQAQRFDVIILDPPALIKRKKDFKAGFEAYRRLNQLALQVLAKDGVLVSASCSHHLSRDNLVEILRACARHLDKQLVFFGSGGQAGDHPIHPALPETEYLKTYFCAVSQSF